MVERVVRRANGVYLILAQRSQRYDPSACGWPPSSTRSPIIAPGEHARTHA
jgi:hypothetical protein